ncbi:MAG TPA: aminotransferase class V-fold PLP-dependent enzyme [Gemmatimonadota bacterium]|nr:aminotransferase class V-fold PLP-dependent enzyme [Gemmatimonadota bacterium]
MDRRRFLATSGAATAGVLVGPGAWGRETSARAAEQPAFDPTDWDSVRGQFPLAPDEIDLSALYLSSHPLPVRDAIAQHRRALDARPTRHVRENDGRRTAAALSAAARYMGAEPSEIALVDSTTMGLGLLYTGLDLHAGQEALTTSHDYYVTHESLRLATERNGARVRKIALYDVAPSNLTPRVIEEAIVREIRPETRVLALTWVHSGTGLALPLARIASRVREVNARRAEPDRVLLCVDGVHGFGCRDEGVDDLGFDFFAAGCHKWLFGPRGTGILWGRSGAWRHVRPTIPSFDAPEAWTAWFQGRAPTGPTTARRATPGGFKPFEHRWALTEAFEFHRAIGRGRVAERTHALARRLKEGLAQLGHVRLATPMADEISAGIVCFDVTGRSPGEVVARLYQRGIVGTVTPYATRHVRLSPSIRNSEAEVDAALDVVAGIGPARIAVPEELDIPEELD